MTRWEGYLFNRQRAFNFLFPHFLPLKQKITEKNCTLKEGLNLNCQRRRRVCWPYSPRAPVWNKLLFLTQRVFTYFVRGSITVRLTICFTCSDSSALLLLIEQHINLIGWIHTSETGGQPYCDTFPYKVSEYSLAQWAHLRLPYLSPQFKSFAPNLCFFHDQYKWKR